MSTVYPVPENYPSEIIGYAQPWIVDPGDSIDIKVSSTEPEIKHRTFRVLQGTQCEDGPEPQYEEITAVPHGRCPGRFQLAHQGSYAVVSDIGLDEAVDKGLGFSVCVQPWMNQAGHHQAFISNLNPSSKTGLWIGLDELGHIIVQVGQEAKIQTITTDFVPSERRWTKLELNVQAEELQLDIRPLALGLEPPASNPIVLNLSLDAPIRLGHASELLLAASRTSKTINGASRLLASSHFNGRLESVMITAIGEASQTLASYDFSIGIATDKITDTSGSNRTGRLINAPSRAVKGMLWDGSATDWTRDARGYGAIHFHEDDLDDAEWQTDFSITMPSDARSGVYVVHLESVSVAPSPPVSDQVVFFVRPTAQSKKSEKAALPRARRGARRH
ncbi:hypothetical protein NQ176_g7681 [Zarea fungicola]|uniref:Uncharacterized protein n=1 Tax=Zarea fungicola TaxID=93591 RepID=A0ACC1MXA4_9HYPO|nr:hypothetical protein NQ176_g7681 [Lecanicillium fungicola]